MPTATPRANISAYRRASTTSKRELLTGPDGRATTRGTFASANHELPNADGSGKPVEVESIPDSWFPWYWPQWQ